MADVLGKRVADIETLVWEIPNLLNLRFARFETAIADNASRTAALERVMVGLQSDVRDLRGAVTRQLVEHDRRLNAIEQKLADQARLLNAQDARMSAMEQTLADQDRHLGAMEQTLTDQGRHLGAIEQKLADQDQKLDEILRLLVSRPAQ